MADENDSPVEENEADSPAPATEESGLKTTDANAALDELMKADESNNNLTSILDTPASEEGGFNVADHAAQYDAAIGAAINGVTGAGDSTRATTTGFTDNSGFHQVNASGQIVHETNPTFGSFDDRSNPNDFGSLAKRDLERQGINTSGERPYDFSGINSQGQTIWKPLQPSAPRQDLRFSNFPTAPRPSATPYENTSANTQTQTANSGSGLTPPSLALQPPRKRKLHPDYPGNTPFPSRPL